MKRKTGDRDDPRVSFLSELVKGDVHVDNPDGCVYAEGLGPYARGPANGAGRMQGARSGKPGQAPTSGTR